MHKHVIIVAAHISQLFCKDHHYSDAHKDNLETTIATQGSILSCNKHSDLTYKDQKHSEHLELYLGNSSSCMLNHTSSTKSAKHNRKMKNRNKQAYLDGSKKYLQLLAFHNSRKQVQTEYLKQARWT